MSTMKMVERAGIGLVATNFCLETMKESSKSE